MKSKKQDWGSVPGTDRYSMFIRRPMLQILVTEVRMLLPDRKGDDLEVAERFIRNAEGILSSKKTHLVLRALEPEVPMIHRIAHYMPTCGDYDDTACDWYLHCDIDDLLGPTDDPYALFRRDIDELHATYMKAHPGPRMCLFDDPVDECQILTVPEWDHYIAWLKHRATEASCPRTPDQMKHLIRVMTALRAERKREEAEEGLDPTVVQVYPKFGEEIERIRKGYQAWLEKKNVK